MLMAPEGDRPEDSAALLDAVRHGDILFFNGWYYERGSFKIKKISEEAEQGWEPETRRSEIRGQSSNQ